MIRRRLTVVLGVLLVVGAIVTCNKLGSLKSSPERSGGGPGARAVTVMEAKKGEVPLLVDLTGRLRAEQQMLLNAEVGGTIRLAGKPFRDGVVFRKGEVMLRIDDGEVRSQLLAQKSAFLRSLVQSIPDLRFDLPEHVARWEAFLDRLDLDGPLPALPDGMGTKERNYMAARGILDQYYNVKALEERSARYIVVAPFDGQVSSATADAGTIVTPGTRLGTFTGGSGFELEAGVTAAEARLLHVGDSATLSRTNGTGHWSGRLVRIGETIDASTQTYPVFVEVKGPGLANGLYLSGVIHAGTVDEAFGLPRHAVDQDDRLYLVRDSALVQRDIEVLHKGRELVVVRGLEPGELVLVERLASAYPGMRVTPRTER